jgi:hypothetical protein
MSYTIEGKIISIGEVKNFDNGAKAVDYQVETNEQYTNLYSFDMYKSADNVQHIDNFIKYNKVGDNVRVEWNVRTNEYKGKFFSSLSHWKIEPVNKIKQKTMGNIESNFLEDAINQMQQDDDYLPF